MIPSSSSSSSSSKAEKGEENENKNNDVEPLCLSTSCEEKIQEQRQSLKSDTAIVKEVCEEDEEEMGLLSSIMQQQAEARQLASTHEVRGGLLIPDISSSISAGGGNVSDPNNTSTPGMVTFDAFFDANDEGFSHFQNMLSSTSSIHSQSYSDILSNEGDVSTISEVSISLNGLSVRLHLNFPNDNTTSHVLLRIGDLNAESRILRCESMINVSFGFLDVEEDIMNEKNSIFHFVEDDSSNENLLSSAECCSIICKTKYSVGNRKVMEVSVGLEPFQMIYREEALSNIAKMKDLFIVEDYVTTPKPTNNSHNDPNGTGIDLKMSVNFENVTISVPLKQRNYTSDKLKPGFSKNHDSFKSLFGRAGYLVTYSDGLQEPIISAEFTDVGINASTSSPSEDPNIILNDVYLGFHCQKSIMSISMPSSSQKYGSLSSSESVTACRFDLLSLESETQIDPDALIRLEYTQTSLGRASDKSKRKRAKQMFPTITQLSFLKASQQQESEDIDKTYMAYDDERRSKSTLPKTDSTKSKVRGSDPQTAMLKEAESCERYISIHLPSVTIDLSSSEMKELSVILKQLSTEDKNENEEEDTIVSSRDSDFNLGLTLHCDQVSITLYDYLKESGYNSQYSQILICDGIHMHSLLNSGGLKSSRFICDDIILYEESGVKDKKGQKLNPPLHTNQSISCRCNLLRKRRKIYSTSKVCKAIFFRSKLSSPLSPATPVFCVDLTIRGNGNNTDQTLHVMIYDLTYRCDIESQWIRRLSDIFDSLKSNNVAFSETKIRADNNDALTVTNLFMTISDCNVDYTSPDSFKRSSRSIIRVGEIRVTSNIISPAGRVQAFKIAVSDVVLYLSNKRVKHINENSRLSCANLIMNSSDLNAHAPLKHSNDFLPQSFENALFNMDFLSLCTLDCFDAAIALATEVCKDTIQKKDIDDRVNPDIMVTLSLGRACLFACKDSFLCLTETIGDLSLHLTMPSTEEIEIMRLRDAEKKNNDKTKLSTDEFVREEKGNAQNKDFHEADYSFARQSDLNTSLNEIMERELFNGKNDNNCILGNGADRSLDVSTSTRNEQQMLNGDSLPETEPVMIHDFYAVASSEISRIESHNLSIDNEDVFDAVGQGWTTVDHSWSQNTSIPDGEDQCGGWYSDFKNDSSDQYSFIPPDKSIAFVEGNETSRVPRVFPRHIPLNPVSDPLSEGDMGASKFTGMDKSPEVNMRVIIQDMSLCCRFFDGYDWKPPPRSSTTDADIKKCRPETNQSPDSDIKTDLMNELLGNSTESDHPGMFEEENNSKKSSNVNNREQFSSNISSSKCRQPHRFFQFRYSGLKLRLDTYKEARDHCLASCMDLSMKDMFLSETVSSEMPVKIYGEWANDSEHPRDLNDGLLMMKMITMHPENQLSADGKLMSDEARVTLELLPIRCFIHQSALRFIRSFFRAERGENESQSANIADGPPEMFFQVFKVRPLKLKVNYTPYEIDTSALKDGNYIEILNLLPLEEMILKLRAVEMRNLTGWGSVFSEVACKWVQDVSATQMHKFLTSSPIHPIANVGDGVKKFVMIPLEEYKQHGHVRKGLRRGTTTLAEVVAFETLNVSSKLTSLAAKKLGQSNNNSIDQTTIEHFSPFPPPRSSSVPKSMGDVSNHAVASLSRGLKEANTKIVIIPYREYHRTGTKGLMKSVIKGIPVAICAPLSGAAEALSYGLLGVRNQIRPELRREEEASNQFDYDD